MDDADVPRIRGGSDAAVVTESTQTRACQPAAGPPHGGAPHLLPGACTPCNCGVAPKVSLLLLQLQGKATLRAKAVQLPVPVARDYSAAVSTAESRPATAGSFTGKAAAAAVAAAGSEPAAGDTEASAAYAAPPPPPQLGWPTCRLKVSPGLLFLASVLLSPARQGKLARVNIADQHMHSARSASRCMQEGFKLHGTSPSPGAWAACRPEPRSKPWRKRTPGWRGSANH